jgi:methylmalonyl-CoA/ethylmalonyl-CoA epimerase
MFSQVDHIAIATLDVDAAVETLRKLGPVELGEMEIIERDHIKAQMLRAGDVPIELLQPTSPDSTVQKFIDKRGEGIHHIAYRVADINKAIEQCKAAGLRLIDEKPRHGYADSRVAFLHPKALLGALTELVQREPGKDVCPYAPAHE